MATPIFATSVIRLLTSDIGQLWGYLWQISSPVSKFLLICVGMLLYKTCITLERKIKKKIEKKDLEVIDTKIDSLTADMDFVKNGIIEALAKRN